MFERQKEPEDRTVVRDEKEYEHLAQRAAVLLANSFKVLTDGSIRKVTDQLVIDLAPLRSQLSQSLYKQQQILDPVPAKLTQVETQLTKVQTSQQQVIYSLEHIEKQLEQHNAESKLLENASQENHLLSKEHYQEHVIQPMVRSLFPLFDFIEETRCSMAEHDDNGEIQEFVEGVFIQLRQFLSAYEIEPIWHKPRAKFNPSLMKPVKTVATDNSQLDSRVAKSLQAGFWWRRERILRFETVTLYKFREAKLIAVRKERSES